MSLITISQSVGSGGEVIAKRVAEALNLELYDDKRLQQAAIDMGIPSKDLKKFDEKAPGLFDRIMSTKPETYLDLMNAVVYDVAHMGNGVIWGHGSQILLRDFGCALHVFIHATGITRLKYVIETKGLSQEAAEKYIRKRDNQQKGFFRFAFHMDWNDPSLYDLIVNTEKMGIESAVRLVTDAASSDEIKACSITAVEAMERLSQKKKVEAKLVENDINVYLLHVDVPEKGVAYINGTVYTSDEKERIMELAETVEDISEVRSDLAVMPASY